MLQPILCVSLRTFATLRLKNKKEFPPFKAKQMATPTNACDQLPQPLQAGIPPSKTRRHRPEIFAVPFQNGQYQSSMAKTSTWCLGALVAKGSLCLRAFVAKTHHNKKQKQVIVYFFEFIPLQIYTPRNQFWYIQMKIFFTFFSPLFYHNNITLLISLDRCISIHFDHNK